MDGRLPDFLIVGAMRCGTTSLARAIGAHPEAFMAEEKEIRYFDRHYDRGQAWYAARFEAAGNATVAGEATQTYLYDPVARGRMAEDLPHAKLLAILRDPTSRAYSHYWLNRERDREPLSFRDALAAEPERLAAGDQTARFLYSYVDRGRYAQQLRALYELYPSDRVHVLLLDDLRGEPRATFGAVCRFLGVDPDVVPTDRIVRINSYRHIRSSKVRSASKRLPAPLGRIVAALNSAPDAYAPLEPALRAEVVARFEDDIIDLERLLDRRLDAWRSIDGVPGGS